MIHLVKTSGTMSDNEGQRVRTSNNEWQRVTTNDNESHSEWQTNEDKLKQVKQKKWNSKMSKTVKWNKRPIWFLDDVIQIFMQYIATTYSAIYIQQHIRFRNRTSVFNKKVISRFDKK